MRVVIEVENLSVAYRGERGTSQTVLSDITFSLAAGKILCLIGESGSGKSTLGLSLLGLLPSQMASVRAERITLCGHPLSFGNEQGWQSLRGKEVGYVFQDPFVGLNPLMRAGEQIEEALRLGDEKLSSHEFRLRGIEKLKEVGLADPHRVIGCYPHELSGGLRQRVLLAMALARNPRLLIADEPTSSLDATLQRQVLDLFLQKKTEGMSALIITHDFGVVASVADEVMVMHEGKIVEKGQVDAIFESPQHPYTQSLLALRW